jgi:hypothetical protein
VEFNLTATPNTGITKWQMNSIANLTGDKFLGLYPGSDDDSYLYALGWQNSLLMLTKINSSDGTQKLSQSWTIPTGGGSMIALNNSQYDYNSSISFERKNVSTNTAYIEVVVIAVGDDTGVITIV